MEKPSLLCPDLMRRIWLGVFRENWGCLDGIEEARCTDDHARETLGELKARGPTESSGECSICFREGRVIRKAYPREGSAQVAGRGRRK